MTSGWYYLNSNVTKNGRVESITGDVYLILKDGCTLDVKGLYVPAGSTLTIYGQSAGTGKLYSHPSGGAGIGGYDSHDNGNIVIHGGTVEAIGHESCAGIGGNSNQTTGDVTIYGGIITATGGRWGAGIGAGRNKDGGTIKIYGGTVTASASEDSAAGIGGGDTSDSYEDFTTIKIYGGTVTATGKSKGAGIGGGEYGHADITITGGDITAVGGSTGGAGIGSGVDGKASTITITGGVISAKSADSDGFGIGDGKNKKGTSTVTLGYTDATVDSIDIFASSFSGTVTLQNPFGKVTGSSGVFSETFYPGTADSSQLGGGHLKPWDGAISTWQGLQQAISSAGSVGRFKLTKDLTATYGVDSFLSVASGQDITIDLNGHTLDRDLTEYAAPSNGYVISNAGTLTLTNGVITGGNTNGDAGGIINAGALTLTDVTVTGNKCTGSGGGIYNSGTVIVNSGSITGNNAGKWGGGIYLSDSTGAVLHLRGGSVTDNTCGSNGGGIHVSGTAAVKLSGSPVVTGNRKNSTVNNINLAANAVFTVTDKLTAGANLGVSSSSGTAVITTGYGAKNGSTYPGAFFHADNTDYVISLKDGEVNIASPFNVTVNADDVDRLSVDKPKAGQGDTVTVTVLDGTALNKISVYYTENGSTQHVALKTGANNTATFTMPGADVTVKINPPVTYYENGSKTYNGNYTVVTSDTTTRSMSLSFAD